MAHQVLVDASNSILCHVMDRFDRVALRIAKDIVGVRAEHCRLPRNRFDRDFFAGLGLGLRNSSTDITTARGLPWLVITTGA